MHFRFFNLVKEEKTMNINFKNLGHAIATGAKYFEMLVVDAVKVSAKAQVLEPEAIAVVTAVAGPQAAQLADLGFHALGDIAAALEPLNEDTMADVAAKGLNVQMDLQTMKDVKALVAVIQKLLNAKGTPAPAPTPKA
jgi:hypothetical protein